MVVQSEFRVKLRPRPSKKKEFMNIILNEFLPNVFVHGSFLYNGTIV